MSDPEKIGGIPGENLGTHKEELKTTGNTRPKSPFQDLILTLSKDDPHRIDASYPENDGKKEESENNKSRTFEVFVEGKGWVPYHDNMVLHNLSGIFTEHCMPTNLPTQINPGEIIPLDKGYYKGIIFDMPGVEVKINGQWIPYNDENKSLIKTQEPSKLKFRLSGNLLKKQEGDYIEGEIVAVDNNWNSLNISKKIRIKIR